MATVSFAIAQFSNESVNPANAEVTFVQQNDEWKAVNVADLSASVQEVIKSQAETYDVKAVLYNATTKQAKVTFVAKADKSEKVVVYDEAGKEVK